MAAAAARSLLAAGRAGGGRRCRARTLPAAAARAAPYCTVARQQRRPPPDMRSYLWSRYREAKRVTKELVPSIMSNMLNPDAIFSNNEMSLSDIEIYGFDYDYTLVFYSKHLHTLIFNAARDLLINEHRPDSYEVCDCAVCLRGALYDSRRSAELPKGAERAVTP